MFEQPQEGSPTAESKEPSLVPSYDVRNCMVCGKPMEGRKCKYVCRSCGTMIDCSDAY